MTLTPDAGDKEAVVQFAQALEIEGRSLWKDAGIRFMKNRAAVASLIILALMGLAVLVGPLLSPHSYDAMDWSAMTVPPTLENSHWFGTDALGRDLFVRILAGGRISFMVGLLGALVAVVIGILFGAVAGYTGGRVDSMMMRVLEILQSFPFMFLVILMVTLFGQSLMLIFIAIGAVSWLEMARIVRGQTISLKSREFVEAALVCGSRQTAVIVRHIVPNILGIVVIYASLLVPGMILFESFLSFLGLGVQEPMTSWGALVNEGAQSMDVAAWQLILPAGFLTVTLFCFNYIGDGMRDALDTKDR
ncbi:MAG: oligopeptide ABC transporter permease OppC [Kistimonas sp.]|nr:oligopeptide ABC transporter permease OppC [Kistimonas sp.]